jgi:SAM-dependent methyltransferase
LLFRQLPQESAFSRFRQRLFFRLTQFSLSLTLPLYEFLYLLWRRPEILPALARLWLFSLGRNPYTAEASLSPNYRQQHGSDSFVYGEILLPTADRIFDHLKLTEKDRFLDLGCGRGKLVLLAAARGIPARGIELVPLHLRCAEYAARPLCEKASFLQADMLEADVSDATLLWASGTCWTESLRQALAQRLAQLPEGTRILSVSSPLPHPNLPTQERFAGWTTWGRDLFFLQIVQHHDFLPTSSDQEAPSFPHPDTTENA